MTVSELILKIDEILNLDLRQSLDLNGETDVQAMNGNSCCKTLLDCCNFVYCELYCRYALDCRRTVAEAKKGVISLDGLKIGRILSLVDSVGQSAPFHRSSEGLLVTRDGKYNLTYARMPQQLTFASEIEFQSFKFNERIFTYGVIAEYLRIIGDYSASASWTEKYVQAAAVASASKSSVRMPSRRWLQ